MKTSNMTDRSIKLYFYHLKFEILFNCLQLERLGVAKWSRCRVLKDKKMMDRKT